MRHRLALLAACVLMVAVAAVGCTPDSNTTGPYVDTNANGTHDPGEGVGCDTLTPSGPITVNTPGTVVRGLNITGNVTVQAADVTLDNNCVVGNASALVQVQGPNAHGTVISNNRIKRQHSPAADGTCDPQPAPPAPGCDGAMGIYIVYTSPGPHTIVGNDISDVGHGIEMAGDNLTIRWNFIHDMSLTATGTQYGTHLDGLLTNGGSHHLDIEANTIAMSGTDHQTSAFAAYEQGYRCGHPEWGPHGCPNDDVKFIGNTVSNGGRCIYTPIDGSTNFRYEGNRFGPYCDPGAPPHTFLNGSTGLTPGGPVFPLGNPGNTWTDNRWVNTDGTDGDTIPPP